MVNWMRRRRLENLQEQLAEVNARIHVENEMTRQSKTFYPAIVSENAAMKASLEFRIGKLQERLTPPERA